ncbi:hypothetical protein K239x_56080 [Planctomycetes bacterium K23_9]|uniref:Uncharacterized protein n=1 Tax=Stieleria marina TaxID=1930275 RepID=A0A517P2L8_9BACT|nr:hypothetical protein K239x_56080 [Planctomycetes bacterium K23_9]
MEFNESADPGCTENSLREYSRALAIPNGKLVIDALNAKNPVKDGVFRFYSVQHTRFEAAMYESPTSDSAHQRGQQPATDCPCPLQARRTIAAP